MLLLLLVLVDVWCLLAVGEYREDGIYVVCISALAVTSFCFFFCLFSLLFIAFFAFALNF